MSEIQTYLAVGQFLGEELFGAPHGLDLTSLGALLYLLGLGLSEITSTR